MILSQSLEDFSAAPGQDVVILNRDLLAAEYRRGFEDGEAAARTALQAELIAALREGLLAARENSQLQDMARRETLQAVYPLLVAITDRLATETSGRLLQCLRSEIDNLVRAGVIPSCHIHAPATFIEELGRALELAGIRDVPLLSHDRTEIRFDGGRTLVDDDALIASIRAALSELLEPEDC